MGRPKIRTPEEIKEYNKRYSRAHRDEFNKSGRKNYPKYKDSKRDYQRALTKKYKVAFLGFNTRLFVEMVLYASK